MPRGRQAIQLRTDLETVKKPVLETVQETVQKAAQETSQKTDPVIAEEARSLSFKLQFT